MADKTNAEWQPAAATADARTDPVTDEAACESIPGAAESDSRAHLNPRIRQWLDEPQHQRIVKILGDRIIIYPGLERILEEAHWLVLEPRCSRARGIIIQGCSNSGKTEITKTIQRHYPIDAVDTPSNRRPRVLMISMSGARTTKAVLNRILERTGVPISRRYTTGDHETLVIQILRKMNCRLLMLDEVQDVLNFQESEQIRVFEVIKHLMNELGMPVLALGADRAVDAFRADGHLAARFESISIPRWTEGEEFAQFLRTHEEFLPLKFRSDLARPEMQKLLIKRTGGILGNIVMLLKKLALNAVVSGEERITRAALDQDQLRPPVSVLGPQNAG